jgi:hypothetical protein
VNPAREEDDRERLAMDNVFDTFNERIIEAIRTGEVICIFFPRLGKTLIVDLRMTEQEPPAIILDDMVGSPRERLESLQRLRPRLPLPDELRLAPWLGFVRSLYDSGVYDALVARCDETGDASLARRCQDAVQALEKVERDLVRSLIRGEATRTIWQRPAP